MGKYSYLATIALTFNIISLSTLLWRVHQTRNTSSFNWFYLIGNMTAQLLIIIYGFANNSPEIFIPTILLFFGLSYIVFVKIIYHYNDETDL